MVALLAIDSSTREMGWAVFSRRRSPHGHAGARDEGIESSASLPHVEEGGPCHPEWELTETGVIVADRRPWHVDATGRIKSIECQLDLMVETWRPREVSCGEPSLMQFPHQQEGIELLGRAVERWAHQHNLVLHCYPIREIKAALLGRANAGKDELAYVVMTRWGLLGKQKSTHEWNAIAVGDHHLAIKTVGRG